MEALTSQSKAGAQRSPWAREELISRITLSIQLLEKFNNKVNQSNVFNLLGIDKSSLSQEREEEFKVSRLINEILEEYPSIGQDPVFPEHTVVAMGLGNVGSGQITLENLNNNQLILAANLGPALAVNANNYTFKISTENPARKIMTECLWLVLTKQEWFHPLQKSIRGNTYSLHLHNAIHKIAYSGIWRILLGIARLRSFLITGLMKVSAPMETSATLDGSKSAMSRWAICP